MFQLICHLICFAAVLGVVPAGLPWGRGRSPFAPRVLRAVVRHDRRVLLVVATALVWLVVSPLAGVGGPGSWILLVFVPAIAGALGVDRWRRTSGDLRPSVAIPSMIRRGTARSDRGQRGRKAVNKAYRQLPTGLQKKLWHANDDERRQILVRWIVPQILRMGDGVGVLFEDTPENVKRVKAAITIATAYPDERTDVIR